ncbi:MAG: hypothetical protein GXP29_13810, partial [Planctomycetes bacterium]|nr:hypothetical protein [Planctomycetota bacterium]
MCIKLFPSIGLTMCGLLGLLVNPASGKEFNFQNITDLPSGPGSGSFPQMNDVGDIAFGVGSNVWFYDRSEGSFLEITALPGAPSAAFYPRINSSGNIAMIVLDAIVANRDLWLYEAATQSFTNVSTLAGHPGNSQANGLWHTFALNDNNKISFHSGDINVGSIWVYDHTTAGFSLVSNQPGGSFRGRENTINNADQVAYMGFPSTFLYDIGTGVTTNISSLAGAPNPAAFAFTLADDGDMAMYRGQVVSYYDSSTSTFLDLSTLPGYPAGPNTSVETNDMSSRDEITFWRDGDIYFFDPFNQTFTSLHTSLPPSGTQSSMNAAGEVAFVAGSVTGGDVYLALPLPRGDFDGDGDVDDADAASMIGCLSGPENDYA